MSIDLNTLTLDKGQHRTPEQGACLLEATALFAGEPFTDRPACVSPLLAAFGISINDRFGDDRRQELKQFIPRLPGTAGDGQDEARGYMALDWLIRTYTPAFLDLRPELATAAAELRGLRRVVDLAAARAAVPVIRSAKSQAYAARAAAIDAAGSAAADALDAAGAAARFAAYAAIDAAGAVGAAAADAIDAAWEAAAAGPGAALAPTVTHLQTSAIDLYDRMIDPAAVQ